MLIIPNVDITIPDDSGRMIITLNEDYLWTNKRGKMWAFKAGWSSDGHSIPGNFKNFDRQTLAAMAHDLDCEQAQSYEARRYGDWHYYLNMRDLGASMFKAYRRYLAVSAYALSIKGKFKGDVWKGK